ncbi:S-formylglutathione hydrolase [Elysia marginata]|uniref:S-formylglutathione hydrolase n=1 Tax=Elysia marginata TaxID=1093978 RepID=A0AAV4FPC0_9GAST|nr:S-formylglutathione hydrolase [Elysia marginata]
MNIGKDYHMGLPPRVFKKLEVKWQSSRSFQATTSLVENKECIAMRGGLNIEGEDDSYDFGSGAGFYVDATTEKWKKNYRMYSYITKEFLNLVHENFPTLPGRQSVFGHSMGGHGALIATLKNPGLFRSVSAFAPISNPTECAWGHKCFGGYLGDDKDAWKAYDATVLVKSYDGPPLDILIDQGAADNFLTQKQLLPEKLLEACKENNIPCVLRMKEVKHGVANT